MARKVCVCVCVCVLRLSILTALEGHGAEGDSIFHLAHSRCWVEKICNMRERKREKERQRERKRERERDRARERERERDRASDDTRESCL